jgi:hypothetical protein
MRENNRKRRRKIEGAMRKKKISNQTENNINKEEILKRER